MRHREPRLARQAHRAHKAVSCASVASEQRKSRSAIEAERETVPRCVLVDPETAAGKHLKAELSHLLATVREPEVFERRLFSLARQATVLDGVRLARLAQANVPKGAQNLRLAGRRVVRQLHMSAVTECDRAGYPRLAVAHLIRGMLSEPNVLLRRRSIGILVRCLVLSNWRNRLLCKEAALIFRLLNEFGVHACLFGSLAISLHAGRFIKRHGDIDLVFQNEKGTHRAAALLAEELKYRIVRRHEWIGLTGERCFHIGLRAANGIPVELSYLPENPRVNEQALVLHGVPVCAADLQGLRRIYALFLVKKAATSDDIDKRSKMNAILAIDRLLASKRTRREAPR